MRLIPTRIHGVLDYLSAVVLFILPRLLGWGSGVTLLLTLMAIVTVVYSLATRYELGLFRVLPMKAHLIIDILSGLLLVSAGFVLRDQGNNVRIVLVLFGLFEIAAPLLTDPTPAAGYAEPSR